jgi:hypothetical protein
LDGYLTTSSKSKAATVAVDVGDVYYETQVSDEGETKRRRGEKEEERKKAEEGWKKQKGSRKKQC